jgi:hypothetical protein
MELKMTENDLMAYPNKWFILMHESLYDEDPNLIGFRDANEWRPIFEEDLVVYYQFGHQRIKGLYEIVESRKHINLSYGSQVDTIGLPYQCRLKLVHHIEYVFDSNAAKKMSFYKHLKNPVRWDNRRAFEIKDSDLKYLLSLA